MITDLFGAAAGAVWKHFQDMCNIPRPSGHEERIRAHLLDIARGNGWQRRQDSIGNIVLACPGIGTLGDEPVLVLQAHMDMVCEKNADTLHDFMTDPIRPLIDGDWVTADGTTLGADNGIGVALALAVAESTMDRVPLELLITIDEERGLTGAFGCDPEIIQGRRIINLDSEEDGVFIIGCAGGTDWTVSFAKSPNACRSGDCWHCCLGGFRGGHSGVDIDKGRVNAIRTAAAIVEALAAAHTGLQVTGFAGGNAMNAIPRECSFTVAGCARDDVEAAAAQVLAGVRHAEWLRQLGCDTRVLSPAECLALEPALAHRAANLVGGIHTGADESGDAYKFTTELAAVCAARGVQFRYGETVAAIEADGGRISAVRCTSGRFEADSYILSLGSYSPLFLRPLGISLPVFPTKGYSITVPITGDNSAPQISLSDEENRIVYSRLGSRMRVAGTAEFSGYDTEMVEARARTILAIAKERFPAAGDFDKAELWCGLRPLTPDGVPLGSADLRQRAAARLRR